ncbi:MAG: hypothetical protein O3B01_19140 [Planctomycetota bacterium]|nr:hypothetical protein [Planctomycetota bacterium]MDA1140688.1 hypothetical protein [Planctomycetota bacterium]
MDERLDNDWESGLVTNLLWWSVVNPTVCKPTKRDMEDAVGPMPNDGDGTMAIAILVSGSCGEMKMPQRGECVELWCDCERLQMLDVACHRQPILDVRLSFGVSPGAAEHYRTVST